MKEFNTTAVCIPSKHYMVDITERVKEIKKMVDAGKYFTINRARQYGKTTTLRALQQTLSADYVVLNLSFELISSNGFQTEASFVQAFSRLLHDRYEFFGLSIPDKILSELNDFIRPDSDKLNLDELYRLFRKWIISSDKPIVMLIDEVDNASNNQVFVDFLGMLRGGYISREAEDGPAFQSVILAGVTDIKYLKSKIRSENQHRVNSPWNIAADFDIDMSLSREGIAGMLTEYEADHHTGMDIPKIAALLRDFTNGYPFLVSRICQLIDVEVSKKMSLPDAWTQRGFDEAVKMLLVESNTLFQSLTGKLTNNPELKDSLRSILMEDKRIDFNTDQEDIALLDTYGFIRNDEGAVRIDNRIFETVLYNLFLSDEEIKAGHYLTRKFSNMQKYQKDNDNDDSYFSKDTEHKDIFISLENRDFVWDDAKNKHNQKVHHINFETAMFVFNDSNRIEIYDELHSANEERWNTIGQPTSFSENIISSIRGTGAKFTLGKIHGLLFVVYTDRIIMGREMIRLISARRATKFEEMLYINGD